MSLESLDYLHICWFSLVFDTDFEHILTPMDHLWSLLSPSYTATLGVAPMWLRILFHSVKA